MTITSNYSTLPVAKPHPNAVLQRLPVVIREKVGTVPLPVQYEEAVKALQACTTIGEAKYYADKATAMAAYAKVIADDRMAAEARRIKVEAYDKMGRLAEEIAAERAAAATALAAADAMSQAKELRATATKLRETDDAEARREASKLIARAKEYERGRRLPRSSGNPTAKPVKILREHGLSNAAAVQALHIARSPREHVAQVIARAGTPAEAARLGIGLGRKPLRLSDAFAWLKGSDRTEGSPQLSAALAALRKRPPRDIAFMIPPGEVKAARELAIELIEWLDEFEQALPKDEQK